jgi:hypothetical protein
MRDFLCPFAMMISSQLVPDVLTKLNPILRPGRDSDLSSPCKLVFGKLQLPMSVTTGPVPSSVPYNRLVGQLPAKPGFGKFRARGQAGANYRNPVFQEVQQRRGDSTILPFAGGIQSGNFIVQVRNLGRG